MEAVPSVTGTGLPMSVVPFSNCTVPVAPAVTVAVRVTEVPKGWGLAGVGTSVVVVGVTPPYTTDQVLPVIRMSAES